MTRRPLLVANWKMYKTVPQSVAFGRELVRQLADSPGWDNGPEVVVCPTLPALWPLGRVLLTGRLAVGVQNVSPGQEGPRTGELSAYLAAADGATFAIVGHSERRQHCGETDSLIAEKVQAALEAHLCPILCVGETADERSAGRTEDVVLHQLRALVDGGHDPSGAVVAYEPVWAIGSGVVPDPAQANHVAALIRQALGDRWGEAGRALRILYGGSVTARNLGTYWAQPDIDGALVGGASLKVSELVAMATAANAREVAP